MIFESWAEAMGSCRRGEHSVLPAQLWEIMPKEKEIKEKTCSKCNEELTDVPQSFDAMDFLSNYEMKFCDNPKCKLYRVVIIVNK